MIVDLQIGSPDLRSTVFDICIVGGGVAGITLALKFAAHGRRVVLLEAGGRTVSQVSQDFYRGENTGTENLPLHETRLRVLGGSSNHWGGWCRPFDPYDFQRQEFSSDGSWPITAADLRPHLTEAANILSVNKYAGADLDLKDAKGRLRTARMYFSSPPAQLGANYFERLKEDDHVLLVLNAPVVGAEFDDQSRAIKSVAIGRSGTDQTISCKARHFILAQGTVENVRTLLILNHKYANKLGNSNGLVGRYYLQHLHQKLGQFVELDGEKVVPAVGPPMDRVFFLSTKDTLNGTRNGAFRLYSTDIDCSELTEDLRRNATAVVCSRARFGKDLYATAEHNPNAESRISLVKAKDALEQPRVCLDWRVSEEDRRTLLDAGLEFGRYLIRAGIGRLKINPDILDGPRPLKDWTALASAPGAAGHQMGGARMSRSPADGVVDANCRVWGTENLFVAGAAVFRTCSQTTPTLTIVQLCLRLVQHLHRTLGTP
jgi:choline dehydrogenase-like flavoprotein